MEVFRPIDPKSLSPTERAYYLRHKNLLSDKKSAQNHVEVYSDQIEQKLAKDQPVEIRGRPIGRDVYPDDLDNNKKYCI